MQPAQKISMTILPEMMRLIRESIEASEDAVTSDAMRAWLRSRFSGSRIQ